MRRYYVCKKVITSEGGDTVITNAIAEMPLPEGTGASYVYHPTADWVLVVLSHPVAVPVFPGVADIDVLPDLPLDVIMNAIQSSTRNRMVERLAARGIGTSHIISSAGYRDVIRGVGVQADSNFHEDRFGVPT